MDNDGNNYQGQGPDLVGEERSKVSPVLHPFSLPKFVFDVGHIRFDGLVENEVFLGIPSEEDNQWIEDFSRGSSGLEFGSGPADSCSIPRHNNVWSEATSSESVEMLLKSVGQEKMVPGESTIRDSVAGVELPSLTKQMDDKIDCVEDASSILPSVGVVAKFSDQIQNLVVEDGHDKCISEMQEVDQSKHGSSDASSEKSCNLVVEDGHDKCISEMQEVDQSKHGSSDASSEKSCKVGTEVKLQMDVKSFDENQSEACTSVNKSLREKILDDPSIHEMDVQDAERLLRDASAGIGETIEQSVASDMNHENVVGFTDYRIGVCNSQDNFTIDDNKLSELSAEAQGEDLHLPLQVASVVQTIGECAAEVTTGNLQEPSSFPLVGSSNLQTGGGPSDEGNSVNKEDYRGITHQNGTGSSAIPVESPMHSRVQTESSEEAGHEVKQVDDASLLNQSSVTAENHCGATTPCLDDGINASGVQKENISATDIPLGREVGSAYISGELASTEQVHAHECGQGVLIQEAAAEEVPFDAGKVENDSITATVDGKIAGSSFLGEVSEEKVETTHGSELNASSKNEREPIFEIESSSKVSCETVDIIPPVDSAAEAFSHNLEGKSHQFEKKGEMQMEMPTDAETSSLQVSGGEFQQCPDSEANRVASDDTAAEEVLDDANQPPILAVSETSDAATDAELVVARSTSVELPDKIEVCSAHSEPNMEVREGEASIDIHKPGEPPREKNHVAASSEILGGDISAENEKSNTMSDGVDSGLGISRNDTDEQAGVKVDKAENLPLSNGEVVVAGEAMLNPMASGMNVASEEEKSFTFDVSPLVVLPEQGTNNDQQSSPLIQSKERSMVVEGAPSTSASGQIEPKFVQDVSHGTQQTPGKGALSSASKGRSERKTRRGSSKSGKENTRKGTSVKEAVPLRKSEMGDRLSVPIGSSGSGQLIQLDPGSMERSGAKTGMVLSVPGSGLPDLNTSASTTMLFQQPFTDLQQVQLRAQIFVYGSLIQGVAPDEACMVSSFGISDGGRSFWEATWRQSLERLRGQKSHPSSSETPMQSRSGSKASDQANKHGSSQSKVASTPAGRVNSMSSPVINPMIPLSSPLWNFSTPSCDALSSNNLLRGAVLDYQAVSPLHAYHTSTVQNFTGHTSSCPSQTPFPASWVTSAQSSAVDARFSSQPVADTVKLTPIQESSVAISSTTKHVSPNPIAGGISSVISGMSSLHDVKQTSARTQPSDDKKSRKRKKGSVSDELTHVAVALNHTGTVSASVTVSDALRKADVVEDLDLGVLVAGTDTNFASHPAIASYFSTSVAVATPSNFVFRGTTEKSLTASIDHSKGDSTLEKRLLKSDDIAKVEEAKLQAEEVAGHAAIAVNHCQNAWCQLEKHISSGLMSNVEAKVSSAAVTIAAAASIAKVAAAAAKIASNVALQAKLMADETLILNGTQNPTQADVQSLPAFLNNVGNATPASILNAGYGNSGSSSIIFAAREAARRKIEAASFASRHAENLEAIVKAAELAAEAVSRAGKVVAMGDPLPISKLVEAGPECYWKGSKSPSGQFAKSNNTPGSIENVNGVQEVTNVVVEQLERPSDKEFTGNLITSPLPKEIPGKPLEDQKKAEESVSTSVARAEKDSRGQKNRRTSDLSKTLVVVPGSEIASRSTAYESGACDLSNSGIKEGCLVEILRDNVGAWFSADVLSLKGGKASVCYTDLESAEGSGKLKEWVSLGADGNTAPRIRLAHPVTSLSFEGTRKRRRADARDYIWSIGDKVDAWIDNGWREGVILEKNKKDETTLTIAFPAQGKTSVVRSWHLRPTLVWKDGEWMEWSDSKESLKGDTPQEKRQKLGSQPVEGKGADGKGKGKMSKNMDVSETGKTEESRLLPLTANEENFNVGSTRSENKPGALRTMRSGLQKEGSKVIFGVPKPGKKRKFMEVSKHYVSDHNGKNNSHNDSEKYPKYLIPQGSGWRNNLKIDSKDKQAAESNKPKGLKSGKHPSLSARTLPQRDNSVLSSVSALKDSSLRENVAKEATSNNDNKSGQHNLTEFASSSNFEEEAEEPPLSSLQAPKFDAPRKAAKTNSKSERLKKGRLAPSVGKLDKVEVKDKTVPEVIEPRRSNRRIQPTSRLLEGLQSSLIVSKFPSASRDKSQKSHSRGLAKGNY